MGSLGPPPFGAGLASLGGPSWVSWGLFGPLPQMPVMEPSQAKTRALQNNSYKHIVLTIIASQGLARRHIGPSRGLSVGAILEQSWGFLRPSQGHAVLDHLGTIVGQSGAIGGYAILEPPEARLGGRNVRSRSFLSKWPASPPSQQRARHELWDELAWRRTQP